jgi:hypothetical protein
MPLATPFDPREVEPCGEVSRRLVGGRESRYPAPMVENGWKLYLDLAARLVALAGFFALVWLVGLLWPPGAPPPAAIPVAAPVAAPTIVEPVAPATAPVQVSEMPGPVPEAAPPSESAAPPPVPEAAAPSESAAPPPALQLAPPPPAMPATVAPRELRPASVSDARLLNLLELRRIERTPRRQR